MQQNSLVKTALNRFFLRKKKKVPKCERGNNTSLSNAAIYLSKVIVNHIRGFISLSTILRSQKSDEDYHGMQQAFGNSAIWTCGELERKWPIEDSVLKGSYEMSKKWCLRTG